MCFFFFFFLEYLVLWPFEAQNASQVSVEAGEIVYLLSDENPDWLKVMRNDRAG